MEIGSKIRSKNKVKTKIIAERYIEGTVYKIDGDSVYFVTEDNELKCFNINNVIEIEEEKDEG